MSETRAYRIEQIVREDRASQGVRESAETLTAYLAARVANLIETIREKEGVTLEELGLRVGSSKSHMSRVLSGRYTGMSLSTLIRLAHALGYEPDITLRPLRTTAAPSTVRRGRPSTVARRATARRVAGRRSSSRAPRLTGGKRALRVG